ncbi:MAG: N-acetyltransferase [Firmicutes bacterium HGW-Firmicutes-11]|jgi:phosphinothricin acetyltransferase|nr:MAG: N-acetyltransferase [Firmicutes bacterium HGW-Firmicutes-11]
MSFTIEEMKPSDWPQVAAIYLAGIKTGLATFQRDVPSWEKWDRDHFDTCRFVARSGDTILGWAALTPASDRCAYAGVAEVSVYVSAAAKGQGVGTSLLTALVQQSEENSIWTLQAGIIKENAASRELHKKCGFREIGMRERIGQMPDGQWHDVVLMERRSKLVGGPLLCGKERVL